MKTVNDNGFNQSMNKKSAFLRFMRYVAVILVTVWLFVLMIASAEDDFFDSLRNCLKLELKKCYRA